MSKKLNESGLQSELSGSAFFQPEPVQPLQPGTSVRLKQPTRNLAGQSIALPDAHDTTPGPMTPRHHGPTTEPADDTDLIEAIRRAVKTVGKEDATYRFTAGEKRELADIVYTFGSSGIRTSQNELTRIALNNLLEDYRANGATSVLARVLERLNA